MMYKNLKLFVILNLLFLLVNKVVHGQNFIPGPRLGQAAVLIGDRIYYIGGLEVTPLSNFFYLEFDKTWVDLASQGVNLPLKAGYAADIGGVNQDLIFIIGGLLEVQNTVYQFDTKTNTLSTPIIQGKIPTGRGLINSVSYKGKIYLFGGMGDTIYDGIDIFDTINLSWGSGSLINAPLPRFGYTATLVGEIIYYIGGLQQQGVNQNYNPLSNIHHYNIGTDTWDTKTATSAGVIPGVRSAHTAILVGGKIYIFGGYLSIDMIDAIPPIVPIAMLDTTTLIWSIPPLDNPKVPNVAFHSATLINKLMLIAFGNLTDVPGGALNNNFYVFDLGNPIISWTTLTVEELGNPKSPINLNPTPSNTPSSTPSSNNDFNNSKSPSNQRSSNQSLIVGLSVGLLILGIALVVAFLLYIKYIKKKKQKDDIKRELTILPSSDQNFALSTPPHSPKGLHEAMFLKLDSEERV